MVNNLRSAIDAVVDPSGSTGAVTSLADLGFQSNGQNDSLSLTDSSTLTTMLTSHLSDVEALFTNSTSGLATSVNSYIVSVTGTNGILPNRTADLTAQNTDLTNQISNLESKINADTDTWNSEFQNMETAESQTNQELTYLSQSVSSGSL